MSCRHKQQSTLVVCAFLACTPTVWLYCWWHPSFIFFTETTFLTIYHVFQQNHHQYQWCSPLQWETIQGMGYQNGEHFLDHLHQGSHRWYRHSSFRHWTCWAYLACQQCRLSTLEQVHRPQYFTTPPLISLDSGELQWTPVDSSGLRWTPVEHPQEWQWTNKCITGVHWSPLESTGVHWTPPHFDKTVHTVPFHSIQQSRVTGHFKMLKCHDCHGNFHGVPNSFGNHVTDVENFGHVTATLGGHQNQNFGRPITYHRPCRIDWNGRVYCTIMTNHSLHCCIRKKNYFYLFVLNQKKIYWPSQSSFFQKLWTIGWNCTVQVNFSRVHH